MIFLALLAPIHASATRLYWDADADATEGTGGTGTWDASSLLWRSGSLTGTLCFWTNASPNPDYAQFSGTAGTVTMNSDSVDLNLNRIIFETAGYTIQGPASGSAKLVLSGTTPTIAVGNFGGTILANIGGDSLAKTGTNLLVLGGNNTFGSGTFALGNNGYLRLLHSKAMGNYTVINLGTGGAWVNGVELEGGLSFAYDLTTGGRAATAPQLVSLSGNNVWSGNYTVNAAGGSYSIRCNADSLTINGNVGSTIANTAARPLVFGGAGNIIVNGLVWNNAGYPVAVTCGGPGSLTLNGANTYTGGTTVSGGQLNINNGGTGTASSLGSWALTIAGGNIDNTSGDDVTLASNNAINWNSSFVFPGSGNLDLGTGPVTLGGNVSVTVNQRTLTLGGPLSGAGTLTKAGAGTLVLGGNNMFGGSVLVEAGNLVTVSGGAISPSPVTVAATSGNTSALVLAISDTTKQWTCGGLTVNNGGNASNIEFDFGSVAPSTTLAPLNVQGEISFVSAPVVTVQVTALNVSVGASYPLIAWNSGSITAPAVSLVVPGRSGVTGHLEVAGNSLNLVIDSKVSSEPLSWVGGDGVWDVGNSANKIWKDALGAATYYMQGDAVLFDTVAGTGGEVTLDATVSPSSLVVVNSTADYTFKGSGSIAGSAALVKSGAGRLTLSTTNGYSGGTTLNGGVLAVKTSPDALGTGPLALNSGTLDLNSSVGLALGRNTTLAGDVEIIAERDAAGPGVSYSFGTLNIGVPTVQVSGGNVDSGTTVVSFGTTTLNGDVAFTINSPSAGGKTMLALGGIVDNGSARNLSVTGNGILGLSGLGSVTYGGIVTTGPGAELQLNGGSPLGAAVTDVINNGTLTIGANQNLQSVSGPGAIHLANGILTVNNWTQVQLATPISGAGGLTMNGSGQLELSGNNTYTGPTAANAGMLILSGPGSATSAINISGSGIIRITDVRAVGTGGLRFNTGATALSLLQLQFDGGGLIPLNNPLGINSSLNVTIEVNNNGSGADGMIQLLGNSGIGNSTINITGGNGYSLFLENLINTGGAASTMTLNPTTANLHIGNVTANQATGTANFALDGTATGNTIAGVISDKSGGASVGITKQGSGSWTLLGTNTYTRWTRVTAGTLFLEGNASIAASTNVILWGGATLDVSKLLSTFKLSAGQVLSNATSSAQVKGSCLADAGVVSLSYAAGSPAMVIAGGTFTLSSGTIFQVNNTGAALTEGKYLLIAKGDAGVVAGTLPPVVVSGGGVMGTASLEIVGDELFLNVVSAPPTLGFTQQGNMLTFSWEGAGFMLQAQTNSAGLSNNWVPYENGATSPVQVVVDPANPAVFFRLISQ